MDFITDALAQGRRTVNEYEAKQLLAGRGVPVCKEYLVSAVDEAVSAAEKIGFPVVLKASGSGFFHKTDAGGVALNLNRAEDVKREGGRLLKIHGAEALLVQEMVGGDRELMCGLIRDPHYGPCVMFGLGGIMTEVFEDVVFHLAPLTLADAQQMIGEIRHRKLLEPFRGQAAVDTDEIARVLMTLSEIGLERREIRSIDINPLKIRRDGKPIAVDALIGVNEDLNKEGPAEVETAAKKEKKHSLERFFAPESVAVIGASATPGKAGHTVVKNILANDYRGELYLVNPKGGEILGLPAASSIEDLPDGIDLAIVMTPADTAVQVVSDCAAKGIGYFVLAAGGFSEVDESGESLQKELADVIARTGVRTIGPNTAGHTSTPHHFTSGFFPLGKIPRGYISYITQTGNFATHTMRYIATAEHFGVARVIGLGNKIDIDETEALEYMGNDPETKAIFLYLENIKRPRRFIETARRVSRMKPVFMLKGGSTREGSQAAMTHTAAMASDERITDGLISQARITRLYDYSHLVLAAKALAMMPLPRGNRVGFLAPSGAMLVVLSDICAGRWGLAVGELEEKTLKRLQEISPAYIKMRNPVDIWPSALLHGIETSYREAIEALMNDRNIDAVVPILMLTEDVGVPPLDFLVELARKYPDKPLYVSSSGEKKYMDGAKEFLEPRGVPTFPLIEEPFEVLSILNRCRMNMERQ
ncbi:MAG: acetate--CoA ligase family protein [Spirochaetales bacterium]|nr:acetate--CoA ligase family protein [Spirochaetales bacterium]